MLMNYLRFTRLTVVALLTASIDLSNAQAPLSNIQLRLELHTNTLDLIVDCNSGSGALFVYQSQDLESPRIGTNLILRVNAPTTNGLRHTISSSGEHSSPAFFSATHWPGRTVEELCCGSGMVFVPAGPFTMGDAMTPSEGYYWERPLHIDQVAGFCMDKHEVTKALWNEVANWAITNGYAFEYGAQGKATNHPAISMTWNDAVKWCNARSEKEGRVPAYYTSATQTNVYRVGQVSLPNNWVKWNAGYRLPTEAEWEKAARGGIGERRFPSSNTISHTQANYWSSSSYSYDVSSTRGFHPLYYTQGNTPYTSPVGSFAPNGYGLHDMAGNVWEWCWDWWVQSAYETLPSTDPHGPAFGYNRSVRGGSWYTDAIDCRSASRYGYALGSRSNHIGFRTVLAPSP
jgi:formylglycine-generating enzyme required for sulfatase activity